MEHLDAASVEDVQEFFRIYYAPNNAVLSIAGSFEIDEVKKLVEIYFADIPSQPLPPKLDVSEPGEVANTYREWEDRLAPFPAFLIGWKIPKRRTPEFNESRVPVGYLPEQPYFHKFMTPTEIVSMHAALVGIPRRQRKGRVSEVIELVGLAEKADRPIKGFSGGERQRLGIAQAQVNYPDLLILDEPAASLDPQGRHDVLDVMERLRKYTTIFYSTHILDDVQRVSDTVCILNKGMLVALAPIGQLLAGGGEIVYQLNTQGEVNRVKALVCEQPWVKDVRVAKVNGYSTWEISITDESMEDQLLRLVMSDTSIRVRDFGRRQQDLEDVFLNLVGEVNHDNQ
jgi:ABC-2 type transport system ATP-binding protein